MNRYAMLGCYGEGNLGDEAILAGMKYLIRLSDRNATFTIYIGDEKYERTYSDKAVLDLHLIKIRHWYGLFVKGKILDILRSLLNSDVMIIGGGELIRDDFGFYPLLGIFEKVILTKLFRKKLLLLGIGVGCLETKMGKLLTKKVISWADKVVVRDTQSRDILLELSPLSDIKVCCDVAFALSAVESSRALASDPLIAISLRDWPRAWNSKNVAKDKQVALFDKFLCELASVLKTLEVRYQYKFLFIPFREEEGDDDGHAIREVITRGCLSNYKIQDFSADPFVVKRSISQCRMMIGMRLHACILALSENIPTVAINYDHKNIKLMQEINMHEYILDIFNADSATYINTILRCSDIDRERIKLTIREKIEKIHYVYDDCFEIGRD